MTPIKQQFRHNPPETYGDCHRAALASLLDLPLDAVPHFMHGLGPDDGEEFYRRQDAWLSSLRLVPIVIALSGDLPSVCRAMEMWNGGRLFLLGGESRSGVGHTVVAGPEGIVHDPHPDNVGITGPMQDGFYWVTYILREIGARV